MISFGKPDVPTTPSVVGETVISFTDIEHNIEVFHALYKTMPKIDNRYGMRAPHLFLLWNALEQLTPDFVIESGVYKGLGTWWIEQSCPDAQIYCIDVDYSNIEYKSSRATYLSEDFSRNTFEDVDKSKTVIFFDDHQNMLMRLMQMKWMGFRRAIFDDNYAPYTGDCYSCKKILAHTGNQWGWDIITPNSTDSHFFKSNISTYQEFPAPFAWEKTRFGYDWKVLSLLETPNSPAQELLYNEADSYTHMCFVELLI